GRIDVAEVLDLRRVAALVREIDVHAIPRGDRDSHLAVDVGVVIRIVPNELIVVLQAAACREREQVQQTRRRGIDAALRNDIVREGRAGQRIVNHDRHGVPEQAGEIAAAQISGGQARGRIRSVAVTRAAHIEIPARVPDVDFGFRDHDGSAKREAQLVFSRRGFHRLYGRGRKRVGPRVERRILEIVVEAGLPLRAASTAGAIAECCHAIGAAACTSTGATEAAATSAADAECGHATGAAAATAAGTAESTATTEAEAAGTARAKTEAVAGL